MKKSRKILITILSGIISLLFLYATRKLAFYYHISGFSDFAFNFHSIPFLFGYNGTSSIVYIYYGLLWFIISFILSFLIIRFSLTKNKKRYLLIGFITFSLLSVLYIFTNSDNSNHKKSYHKKENLVFNKLQNGDIIFQTSKSRQSKAIQLATKSKYSHVGIIYKNGNDFYVYEAVQPVKLTPLKNWINRGENGKYVVKRLINAPNILTDENLKKMKSIGNTFKNKNYDIYFDWSDEEIYCSELVWKIYKGALNIEIGKLEKLKDFDLANPEVKKIIKKRYENNIPLNETVISPVSIFNSKNLETVISE